MDETVAVLVTVEDAEALEVIVVPEAMVMLVAIIALAEEENGIEPRFPGAEEETSMLPSVASLEDSRDSALGGGKSVRFDKTGVRTIPAFGGPL